MSWRVEASAWSPDGKRADLCWGMVEGTLHRQRLGEFLLLGRLHRISTTTNAQYVCLGTCQLTEGFFEHYGFEVLSREKEGIADGLDDVQMRLHLTEDSHEMINRHWQALDVQ